MIKIFNPATAVWRKLIGDILDKGGESAPRGRRIKEIIGHQIVLDMTMPLVLAEGRITSGYFDFAFAEPAWIISGDNRLAPMLAAAPSFARFSDDGRYMRGAYGPKIVDQLSYVVDSIVADPDTRQAVVNIWRENPRASKDVPCSTNVQWLVRGGEIHCVFTMRSSDAWLGWPFDVFSFAMITCWVMLLVKERMTTLATTGAGSGVYVRAVESGLERLKLGTLTLTAGSQHLYESDFAKAEEALSNHLERSHAPLDPLLFTTPDQFLLHLGYLRHVGADSPIVPRFLTDMKRRT